MQCDQCCGYVRCRGWLWRRFNLTVCRVLVRAWHGQEYIGSIATPILFVCLSGVYWRQHQARQAKEAEEAAEVGTVHAPSPTGSSLPRVYASAASRHCGGRVHQLDESQKAEIQAHLQRQKELEKLDRTHPRADSAA